MATPADKLDINKDTDREAADRKAKEEAERKAKEEAEFMPKRNADVERAERSRRIEELKLQIEADTKARAEAIRRMTEFEAVLENKNKASRRALKLRQIQYLKQKLEVLKESQPKVERKTAEIKTKTETRIIDMRRSVALNTTNSVATPSSASQDSDTQDTAHVKLLAANLMQGDPELALQVLSKNKLSELPADLMKKIVQCLEPQEIIYFTKVCKHFSMIVKEDPKTQEKLRLHVINNLQITEAEKAYLSSYRVAKAIRTGKLTVQQALNKTSSKHLYNNHLEYFRLGFNAQEIQTPNFKEVNNHVLDNYTPSHLLALQEVYNDTKARIEKELKENEDLFLKEIKTNAENTVNLDARKVDDGIASITSLDVYSNPSNLSLDQPFDLKNEIKLQTEIALLAAKKMEEVHKSTQKKPAPQEVEQEVTLDDEQTLDQQLNDLKEEIILNALEKRYADIVDLSALQVSGIRSGLTREQVLSCQHFSSKHAEILLQLKKDGKELKEITDRFNAIQSLTSVQLYGLEAGYKEQDVRASWFSQAHIDNLQKGFSCSELRELNERQITVFVSNPSDREIILKLKTAQLTAVGFGLPISIAKHITIWPFLAEGHNEDHRSKIISLILKMYHEATEKPKQEEKEKKEFKDHELNEIIQKILFTLKNLGPLRRHGLLLGLTIDQVSSSLFCEKHIDLLVSKFKEGKDNKEISAYFETIKNLTYNELEAKEFGIPKEKVDNLSAWNLAIDSGYTIDQLSRFSGEQAWGLACGLTEAQVLHKNYSALLLSLIVKDPDAFQFDHLIGLPKWKLQLFASAEDNVHLLSIGLSKFLAVLNQPWFTPSHYAALKLGFELKAIEGLTLFHVKVLTAMPWLTREQVIAPWFKTQHFEALEQGFTYEQIQKMNCEEVTNLMQNKISEQHAALLEPAAPAQVFLPLMGAQVNAAASSLSTASAAAAVSPLKDKDCKP